jgi:hypothetical protein
MLTDSKEQATKMDKDCKGNGDKLRLPETKYFYHLAMQRSAELKAQVASTTASQPKSSERNAN